MTVIEERLIFISVLCKLLKLYTGTWIVLTLSVFQIKTDTCAKNVDLDETARYEPSHQDLHSLPFFFILE